MSGDDSGSQQGTATAQRRRRRLFFALWPDDALRRQIEHDLRKLVRRAGGATVPARNIHVTLVFLGAVDEGGLARARQAAAAVVHAPFDLALDRVEIWPRQRLLCLSPSSPAEHLHDLVVDLRERLREQGFEIERRPFRAHITLARKVMCPKLRETVSVPCWPVGEFALVESVTGAGGSEYSVIDRWRLAQS